VSEDLEPLQPETAVQMYLDGRKDELADATLKGQKYRLRAFAAWCNEQDIENLNELGGRDLYEYRIWRREGGYSEDDTELKTVTLRGQLSTVRAFLNFCASVDAVPESLAEKVPIPSVSGAGGVSDSTLAPSRALDILDYLERYHYASRKHITVLLAWNTGARCGGIRGLDVEDVDLGDSPGVEFRHRPDENTPLKNAEKGERWNAISRRVAHTLEDYIDGPRNDLTDEYGRNPLLTTRQGRPSGSTIRDTIYSVTRPCWRGEECPHDRDVDECEATHYHHASKCPSSRSPHDVRSGRVTAYRREDVPREIVSDRLNASEQVLDRHYDRRSEREKSEQRRKYLPNT